jgi:Ca2+-transporting ATPase
MTAPLRAQLRSALSKPVAGPFPAERSPAVRIIHSSVKGRARFSIDGLYRSEALKKHLESNLGTISSIISISANMITGNMLVFFRVEETHREISLLIDRIVGEYRQARDIDAGTCGVNDDKRTNNHYAYEKSNHKVSRRKLRKFVAQSEEQEEKHWHLMKSDDVAAYFGSSTLNGLPASTVEEHYKKFGPNLLSESVPRSGFSILVDQFKSIPVYLLSASALLSIFTGGVADAVVIMAVVAINAAIGYVTESQSEMTINSLKRLVRPSADVIRDGRPLQIRAEKVLPGDILILRPGSYVTADCRIVDSHYLSIDESALTGESLPVIKSAEPLAERVIPLADRLNMAYMGTLVTGGQGLAVVVGTGRFTEIGRIQEMVGEARTPKTPMENSWNPSATSLS